MAWLDAVVGILETSLKLYIIAGYAIQEGR